MFYTIFWDGEFISVCHIWDRNWTFKHHLIAISRSFKVHPYMVDMLRMASPVLNHFIWLLTYIRVPKHDSMQYGTIANNIPTTTMPFQGHAKVINVISNMHGIWLVAYMCDTCSIPFSGTRNSFKCTKSWLDAIWDHNWTFKHHLLFQGHSNCIHTCWTWYVW